MTCKDIEKVHGNPLGILADRSRLGIQYHGKTFIFIADSRKVANELIDLIKSTCSLR